MLAAAGVGFAGYVYLGPYQKVAKALNTQIAEIGTQRASNQELVDERDKLKSEVAKLESAEHDKADKESKKHLAIEAFSAEMKAALGAFGATTSGSGGRAEIGFATTSLFEQPTSSVISPQGDAALRVLATALKKAGFRTRVMAKLIPAPPPKELSQFKNIGEFAMLRAVRAALALAAGGVAPERVSAAGQSPPPSGAHKGKAAVPERLEIEIEPE
jgi:hypothetical protein